MVSSYLLDSPCNQPPLMGGLHGYQVHPPVWAMLWRVNPKPGTVCDAHKGPVRLLRETKLPLASVAATPTISRLIVVVESRLRLY